MTARLHDNTPPPRIAAGLDFAVWFQLHVRFVAARAVGGASTMAEVQELLDGGLHDATVLRLQTLMDRDVRGFFALCRRFGVPVPAVGGAIPYH